MTVYSLPVSEVISAGPGRVIVEIGAETRVNQARAPQSRSIRRYQELQARACTYSLRLFLLFGHRRSVRRCCSDSSWLSCRGARPAPRLNIKYIAARS